MTKRMTPMASPVESATSSSSDCTIQESTASDWSMDDVDLLATWIDEAEEIATDSPPTEQATASSTAIPPSTDRNVTRQRRRKEVVYLRERAAELEGELAKLRTPEGRTSSEITGSDWEAIAQRQQKARERAELENYKLRGMMESQLKLAHTLERLLRKRDHVESLDSSSQKKLRGAAISVDPESDEVVFERLLSNIDASYAETDQVLTANGLLQAPRGHRVVNVKEQSQSSSARSRAMYVEMTDVGGLPFPLEATASAAWRCITAGYMQLEHEIYHELAGQDDVLAIKYAIALRRRRLHVDFNARAAMKRFVRDDEIVDVWEAISETEGGHTVQRGVPGVRVRERGWTLFRRVPGIDGSSERTLVLSCMQMIPVISYSSSCPDEDRQVGLLTNLALDYYGDQLDQAQHGMESLLLDEARNADTLADLLPGDRSDDDQAR